MPPACWSFFLSPFFHITWSPERPSAYCCSCFYLPAIYYPASCLCPYTLCAAQAQGGCRIATPTLSYVVCVYIRYKAGRLAHMLWHAHITHSTQQAAYHAAYVVVFEEAFKATKPSSLLLLSSSQPCSSSLSSLSLPSSSVNSGGASGMPRRLKNMSQEKSSWNMNPIRPLPESFCFCFASFLEQGGAAAFLKNVLTNFEAASFGGSRAGRSESKMEQSDGTQKVHVQQ